MSYVKNKLKFAVLFLIIASLVLLSMPSNLIGEGDSTDLEALQQAVTQATEALSAAQTAADNADSALAEAQTAAADADSALAEAQASADDAAAALAAAELALADAQAALNAAGEDEDTEALEQALDDADSALADAQTAADDANAALAAAQTAADDANSALSAAQASADDAAAALAAAEQALADAQAALDAAVAALEEEITEEEEAEEILEASLNVVANPESVEPGGSVTYKIVVKNTGNVTLSDIEVLDSLPEVVIFESSSAGEFDVDSKEVSYSIDSLEPGEISEQEIIVNVPIVAIELQFLTNLVTVSSEGIEPLEENTDVFIITSEEEGAAEEEAEGTQDEEEVAEDIQQVGNPLSLSVSDNPDPVGAGQSVTYTINYVNNGEEVLTGVFITDYLPEGTTFVSASWGGELRGEIVVWEIGELEPGQSGNVDVVVNISQDSAEGDLYYNVAIIDSNETEAVSITEETLDPIPSGSQLFYVLGYAPDVLDLLASGSAPGYQADTSDGIHSVLSISNAALGTVTAYLQNYADDTPFDFSNPTSNSKVLEITIAPGEVFTIDDLISASYTSNDSGNWEEDPYGLTGYGTAGGSWQLAGGDLLYISGGPVNVIRGFYPETVSGDDGKVLAEFWNLYPQHIWDTDYTVPVGVDTFENTQSNGTVNTGITTLTDEDVSSTGESTIDVDSASGFSNSGYIKIDDEIIYYGSRDTSGQHSFRDCVRGQLSTTAAHHDDNTTVYQYTTHGDGEDMEYTDLFIQASEDGTTVTINDPVNGTTTVTLNKGDNYIYGSESSNYSDVHQDTTITADKPVQAGLMTSSGENYDTRNYNLTNEELIGTDYYIPVYTNTGDRLYICALEDGTVINIEDGSSTVTINLDAGEVDSTYIMTGNAAHVYSNHPVQVLGAADSNDSDKDWGFQAIPSSFCSSDYVTPYSPGRETLETLGNTTLTDEDVDLTEDRIDVDSASGFSNSGYIKIDDEIIYYGSRDTYGQHSFRDCVRGQLSTTAAEHSNDTTVQQYSITPGDASWNPLYVTPISDNTRVYVDWNGDGTPDRPNGDVSAGTTYLDLDVFDIAYLWDTLESSPPDGDNGGAHIWAVDASDPGSEKIIVVYYGEASGANSTTGYDWGYTLIPLHPTFVSRYDISFDKVFEGLYEGEAVSAAFTLYYDPDGTVPVSGDDITGSNPVSITTNGETVTFSGVVPGDYVIKETVYPAGYVPMTDKAVTLDENGNVTGLPDEINNLSETGTVTIKKYLDGSPATEGSFEFDVTPDDPDKDFTLDGSPYETTINVVCGQTYTITEDGLSSCHEFDSIDASGLTPNSTPIGDTGIEFTAVGGDNGTIIFNNTTKTSTLTVEKWIDDGEGGWKLADEGYFFFDGDLGPFTLGEYPNSSSVQFTVDCGEEYTITETLIPCWVIDHISYDGVILTRPMFQRQQFITFTATSEDGTIRFYDKRLKGSITICKTDEETGEPLLGSTFELQQCTLSQNISSAAASESSTVIGGICNWETIREIVLTESNCYTWSDLYCGLYRVVETSAPQGYLTVNPVEVTIGPDNLTHSLREEIADPRKPGKIGIRKVDENGDAMVGAGFTLYNSTGTTVVQGEKFTDDAGNVAFGNLAWGSYLIVETTVPAGYTKVDDVAVIVNAGNAGTVINVTIKNTPGGGGGEGLTVLGIQELPFTGMHPAVPISSITMILGGLAMFIASLKKRFRRK
jgi:uncharacterized repeat protein (TIGR01451 family)